MSPGSQMRALTATRARAKRSTIRAGSKVERKKAKAHRLVAAFWNRIRDWSVG